MNVVPPDDRQPTFIPAPLRILTPGTYDWMYQHAEEAASAGLPLAEALQAVRDGYSSVEADRAIATDLAEDDDVHG